MGQFPHQMALDADGKTLWVANSGGESISMVDLNAEQGDRHRCSFPASRDRESPILVTPQALIWALSGVMFIKSDGSQWKVLSGAGDAAADQFRNAQRRSPTRRRRARCAWWLANGRQVRHRAGRHGQRHTSTTRMADTFTVSNRIYTQKTIAGYFGPLAAAPDGSYYLANGLVLNSSLSVIGGSQS